MLEIKNCFIIQENSGTTVSTFHFLHKTQRKIYIICKDKFSLNPNKIKTFNQCNGKTCIAYVRHFNQQTMHRYATSVFVNRSAPEVQLENFSFFAMPLLFIYALMSHWRRH